MTRCTRCSLVQGCLHLRAVWVPVACTCSVVLPFACPSSRLVRERACVSKNSAHFWSHGAGPHLTRMRLVHAIVAVLLASTVFLHSGATSNSEPSSVPASASAEQAVSINRTACRAMGFTGGSASSPFVSRSS